MRLRPATPREQSLVLLFEAARHRLTRQTGDVAALPNTRVVTATKELNQVTDDIRDAQTAPEAPAPTTQREPTLIIGTVGQVLRRLKTDR